jgi:hypothetical protein
MKLLALVLVTLTQNKLLSKYILLNHCSWFGHIDTNQVASNQYNHPYPHDNKLRLFFWSYRYKPSCYKIHISLKQMALGLVTLTQTKSLKIQILLKSCSCFGYIDTKQVVKKSNIGKIKCLVWSHWHEPSSCKSIPSKINVYWLLVWSHWHKPRCYKSTIYTIKKTCSWFGHIDTIQGALN